MKRNISMIALIAACAFLGTACCKCCKKSNEIQQKKPIENVTEPADRTDVFGIPLDTSEEEETATEKQIDKAVDAEKAEEAKEKQAETAPKTVQEAPKAK